MILTRCRLSDILTVVRSLVLLCENAGEYFAKMQYHIQQSITRSRCVSRYIVSDKLVELLYLLVILPPQPTAAEDADATSAITTEPTTPATVATVEAPAQDPGDNADAEGTGAPSVKAPRTRE